MFSNLKILVTNDDGIDSLGLKVLVEKLKTLTNDILVVAPNKQMSATSHKITIHEGILLKKEEDIFKNVLTRKTGADYAIVSTALLCVLFPKRTWKSRGMGHIYPCWTKNKIVFP